ncbi:swr1 complex component [Saitoella coloradoensis]
MPRPIDTSPTALRVSETKRRRISRSSRDAPAPTTVEECRTQELAKRQTQLTQIVDEQDDRVRQLFHLEKFSLVEYDPRVAKEDRSHVFTQYAQPYDLWEKLADAKTAGASRPTRRRINAQRDSLGVAESPALARAAPKANGVGKSTSKGKPRNVKSESVGRGRARGRRASRLAQNEVPEDEGGSGSDDMTAPKPGRRSRTRATPEFTSSEGGSEEEEVEEVPSSTSMKSIPKIKLTLKAPKPTIANPIHEPAKPQFSSFAEYLKSFVVLDEEDVDKERLEELIEEQAATRNRIEELRAKGLLDAPAPVFKKQVESPRDPDHHDVLLGHALNFSKLMSTERRSNISRAKKIAGMVTAYFKRLEGADEKERKLEEKRIRQLAKKTVQDVKKKWKLAEKEVLRRRAERIAEEQRKEGKKHLSKILEHSTQLLERRDTFGNTRADVEDEELEDGDEYQSDVDDEETRRQPALEENPYAEVPDSELTVKQLRVKYASVLTTTPGAIDSDDESVADSDDESGDEEEDGDEEEEDQATLEISAEDVRRYEEAMKLDQGAPEIDDEDDFDELMDSEDEEEDSEEEDDNEEEHEGPGLASLFGFGSTAAAPKEETEAAEPADGDTTMNTAPEDVAREVPVDDAEADAVMVTAPEQPKGTDKLAEPEEMELDASDALEVSDEDAKRREAAMALDADAPALPEEDDLDEPMDSELDFEEDEEDAESDGSEESEGPGLAALLDPISTAKDDVPPPAVNGAVLEPIGEPKLPPGNEGNPPLRTETDPDNIKDEAAVLRAEAEQAEVEATVVSPKAASSTIDTVATSVEAGRTSDSPDTNISATSGLKTQIPFLLRATLREYQHIGLDWLANLYNSSTNGILADEMGLGKTIQTISLLLYLACEKQIWGPHLIVVPTSVMLNWETEFKKFAPGMKVMTYYGNPNQRREKRRGWYKKDSFHVCITSYQLVIQDQQPFKRKKWQYMVLDEAHNIKNFRSQRWQTLLNFNTERRLLLTGTPLQNNLMELWSLLYFLMPNGVSENLPVGFANLSEFQEWFGNPVDKMVENGAQYADDEAKKTVTKLHTVLRPYILRRLKADVEKQMPAKHEHVIYCRLSKRQRYLYDDFMSRAQTRETLASGNFLSIINCLMQLRKVCNHPDLFEVRPIVTSFAMPKSVVSGYESEELLVRRRLLTDDVLKTVDLNFMNLVITNNEDLSLTDAYRSMQLNAGGYIVNECNELHAKIDLAMKPDYTSIEKHAKYMANERKLSLLMRMEMSLYVSSLRTARKPIYGQTFIEMCREPPRAGFEITAMHTRYRNPIDGFWRTSNVLREMVVTLPERVERMSTVVDKYACITPAVVARDLPSLTLRGLPTPVVEELRTKQEDPLHDARTKLSIAFPDRRLLQYDCGKLQKLAVLLRDLIAGGHRALIFTQMTKVLDVLEQFLNIHGHRYLRLDGATKIEQRQTLTERFNTDPRIPVFILSTRSGGLGINLTGADTVIFYDSDWNPCMDRQCQDRCHRIGQTRDVHIYRFVSEYTIEENIFRKANQKRMLDNVVIGQGDFTTDWFGRVGWRDMLGDDIEININEGEGMRGEVVESALAQAEDEDDAVAAQLAEREMETDVGDFTERDREKERESSKAVETLGVGTPVPAGVGVEAEEEVEIGDVDTYMINFLEREGIMDEW